MILRCGSSLGSDLVYSPAIEIGGQAKRDPCLRQAGLDCARFVPQGRRDDSEHGVE
jgi:hypothetical protein